MSEYKCNDCGASMNEGEAKTFTCCDDCWDKAYGKKASNADGKNRQVDALVIPQLISKYEKELGEINEGIPQFESMGIMPKVQLQKGKQVKLIEVLDDLRKLTV